MTYVRILGRVRNLPRGLYRLDGQDRERRTVTLTRVACLPFSRVVTSECLEFLLHGDLAEISLKPIK